MLGTDIPSKFPVPFGNAAGGPYIRPIPEASQIGIQAGAASLHDGFPPVTFSPIGSGGTPSFGQDFNGILNQVSAWNRWQAAGGQVQYDGTWATGSASGYPVGAVVQSSDRSGFWRNLTDGNTTNPDSGGAGWVRLGVAETGGWMWCPDLVSRAGWIIANATSIGSASSGATQWASADAAALYSYFWTNFSNTVCPVTGGRGGSAAADFAANKAIGTPDMRGAGAIGMDTMGGGASTNLTGVPVVTGNATTAGSLLGENLHALVAAENAQHNHPITDPTHIHAIGIQTQSPYQIAGGGEAKNVGTSDINTAAASTGISTVNQGSGTAHNTVQRSYVGGWFVHK